MKTPLLSLFQGIFIPFLMIGMINISLFTACEETDNLQTKISIDSLTVVNQSTIQAHATVLELSSSLHPEFGFCYSTTSEVPTVNDSKAILTTSLSLGEMILQIDNLIPGSLYYFRAFVMDGNVPVYSPQIKNITLPRSAVIHTLEAINIMPSSATLRGTVSAMDIENSMFFEYGISEDFGTTIEATPHIVNNGNSNVNAELTGLSPNTTYFFRLKAESSLGTIYGEDMTFTTTGGVYILGGATALTDVDQRGKFFEGINEVSQSQREGMYEIFLSISSSAEGFNIIDKTGTPEIIYGPENINTVTISGNDQPNIEIQKGTFGSNSNKFTVPVDGLYHIAIDKQTMTMVIIPVTKWAILGGATDLGWNDTDIPATGSFSLQNMTFEGIGIALRLGNFKFRHSGGWKVEITDGVKCNINFGGILDLNSMVPTLIPGGANYIFPSEKEGIYTINFNWTLNDGLAVTMTKTGDIEPIPAYPDSMYIAGEAVTYGWNPGAANSEMHKCAGGIPTEGIYWKICHITAGQGFKLSNFNWTEPNLDYVKVDEWDANGVTVTAAGSNWTIAESGMYMIVLNLRDNLVKVSIKPAEVYGIGDAFGTYVPQLLANLFTINNTDKTLVSPALIANGNIRMYAYHNWIPAWWNAEFNVYTTTIEYRNDGNDQTAVPGTVGQIVTLHFDDNTGAIQ